MSTREETRAFWAAWRRWNRLDAMRHPLRAWARWLLRHERDHYYGTGDA